MVGSFFAFTVNVIDLLLNSCKYKDESYNMLSSVWNDDEYPIKWIDNSFFTFFFFSSKLENLQNNAMKFQGRGHSYLEAFKYVGYSTISKTHCNYEKNNIENTKKDCVICSTEVKISWNWFSRKKFHYVYM